MLNITENEVRNLKKYMTLEEISARFYIIPMKQIKELFEEYGTQGMSVKAMADFIELPYDRIYTYYRRWKKGEDITAKKEYQIPLFLIQKVLKYFEEHEKESLRPWTMQDFAVNISEGLEDIPSINYCQRLLKEHGIEWKEYK